MRQKADKDLMMLLFVALFGFMIFFVSLFFGASNISVGEVLKGLFGFGKKGINAVILWKLRVPRVLTAFFVGGGLAVAGAVFQNLLRNPMAEPFTLGISGGGAFGIAVASIAGIGGLGILFFGILGGVVSMLIIYILAFLKEYSSKSLIIGGIAVNYVFSSGLLLLIGLMEEKNIKTAIMWLIGDISYAPYKNVFIAFMLVSFLSFFLWMFRREMDIASMGDEKAASIGVNIVLLKKVMFLCASLIAGICVSSSGIIGFVGLMIPHLARKIAGVENKYLIPASFFLGASFLVICDLIGRVFFQPGEIPAGIITGFAGGIFFLFLALKVREKGGYL